MTTTGSLFSSFWYWQKSSPSLSRPVSSLMPKISQDGRTVVLTDEVDRVSETDPRAPFEVLQRTGFDKMAQV